MHNSFSKNKHKTIKAIKKAYIQSIKNGCQKSFSGASKQIGFRELFHKRRSPKKETFFSTMYRKTEAVNSYCFFIHSCKKVITFYTEILTGKFDNQYIFSLVKTYCNYQLFTS